MLGSIAGTQGLADDEADGERRVGNVPPLSGWSRSRYIP
jgi:hypothetical protein